MQWIDSWKTSTKARLYAHFRPQPVPKDAKASMPRVDQWAITRLRLRNFPTAHWLHKIRKHQTGLCSCGRLETVPHLLIYCPQTMRDRAIIWGPTSPSLKRALFGGLDDLTKTINFLHAIHRL